jgi:hypothetical protein
MATMPPDQERDDEYYEVQGRLREARRSEERAQSAQAESRALHEREEGLISRARKVGIRGEHQERRGKT